MLTPQIKRSADSIALNIAEGSTVRSNRQFHGYAIRFFNRNFYQNVQKILQGLWFRLCGIG
ncbi:MAG: four helix bundle protein [Myxococcota bacterium]